MVARRAENLGITHLFQGVEDKRAVMRDLRQTLGLNAEHCGYMGDDMIDLPLLKACGFSATVPDGHEWVRREAGYVAQASAGAGAVREVCELILRAQGNWERVMAPYLA
jgi:3-deoxy-D-manno-octulosonate 8-phosphate phosphatase (KDO 8-P phosphatase)